MTPFGTSRSAKTAKMGEAEERASSVQMLMQQRQAGTLMLRMCKKQLKMEEEDYSASPRVADHGKAALSCDWPPRAATGSAERSKIWTDFVRFGARLGFKSVSMDGKKGLALLF
jgi:hypothetical protein